MGVLIWGGGCLCVTFLFCFVFPNCSCDLHTIVLTVIKYADYHVQLFIEIIELIFFYKLHVCTDVSIQVHYFPLDRKC